MCVSRRVLRGDYLHVDSTPRLILVVSLEYYLSTAHCLCVWSLGWCTHPDLMGPSWVDVLSLSGVSLNWSFPLGYLCNHVISFLCAQKVCVLVW